MFLACSIRKGVGSAAHELRSRPSGQVASLDALRSFAILLVIGSHWSVADYVSAGGPPVALQHNPVFYYGWAGVDLFFVLSGLLIGKQLWRELERTGNIRVGRFLLRRGLRIWPIYFAMLLAYAAASHVVHPQWPDWLFLSNYVGGGFPRGWSLSTEEQFYIAVPILLLLVRRRIPLAGYLWIFAGIETLVLAVRHSRIATLRAAGIPYDHSDFTLIYPFHVHLEGLLVGLAIALVTVLQPAFFDQRRTGSFSTLGLAMLVAGVSSALALRALDQRLFAFLTLALLFGGATLFALLDRSWLSAPLRWPAWYPISRLSYGMYLNHIYVTPALDRVAVGAMRAVTRVPSVVFLGSLVIVTFISFAAAAVTFVAVEHPFLLLRERLLPPATQPGQPLPVGLPVVAISGPPPTVPTVRWP